MENELKKIQFFLLVILFCLGMIIGKLFIP